MRDEDLLQCPLLQGLDAMHRAQLLGLLNDSNLRAKLEKCLADRPQSADAPANSCASSEHDFEKQVRSWKPEIPLWRRSHKE